MNTFLIKSINDWNEFAKKNDGSHSNICLKNNIISLGGKSTKFEVITLKNNQVFNGYNYGIYTDKYGPFFHIENGSLKNLNLTLEGFDDTNSYHSGGLLVGNNAGSNKGNKASIVNCTVFGNILVAFRRNSRGKQVVLKGIVRF